MEPKELTPEELMAERSRLANTRDPFLYHKISDDCREEIAGMRRMFMVMRQEIVETVASCRHRSMALTHLENCLTDTIKALVLSHPDSVPVED